MAFKRFYKQFTNELNNRFKTDLQLAPSSLSQDVQLIAEIDKRRTYRWNHITNFIGTGGNFTVGLYTLDDLLAMLYLLEAGTILSEAKFANLIVESATMRVHDTAAVGFSLARAGFTLNQTLPSIDQTLQDIRLNTNLGVNTQYTAPFKATDGATNVFNGAVLVDPLIIRLKAWFDLADDIIDLYPFTLKAFAGFASTIDYDAVVDVTFRLDIFDEYN